jgi:hypothetical protein
MKVDNWVCLDCNSKVSSFGCIFDSLKGRVRTFMKVLYENDFLEDFANGAEPPGQEEDCHEVDGDGAKLENTAAEVIYQQY